MTEHSCYPQSFDTAPASIGAADYRSDPAIGLLIEFFGAKGLAVLKAEDRAEQWYTDWIEFQASQGIYASLLSPKRWSTRGHAFDLRRLTRFIEVFAYFSPAHAYSLHVSFLGLFPILSGSNEGLKKEAVAKLEAGGLFAFAVSEQAHGSDLFAGEFKIRPGRPGERGPWIADGSKYYIGNANTAAMVSVLARNDAAEERSAKRSAFTFLAIRPSEAPAFRNVAKIRTLGIRAAFVGSFDVCHHPFAESDVICRGRGAWDAVFRTVDLGKFFLGFGAVGVCERAMTESVAHMRTRHLYGRAVSEMPHVRATTAFAFARLVAMKMYATRALEYMQVAGSVERRYLLFNAVQKARVSTEAVKVLALLSECIGAKATESETYFEMALRDAQLIPGLEGSTHINLGLAAQFAGPYFAGSRIGELEPVYPASLGEMPGENPYVWESRNRNAKTVRFGPPLKAYEPFDSIPNVQTFARQVRAFAGFVAAATSAGEQPLDGEVSLAVGKCFAVIAYGQLVAEQCTSLSAVSSTVAVLFHALIEDLSVEALKLSALLVTQSMPLCGIHKVVRTPRTPKSQLEAISAWIEARY